MRNSILLSLLILITVNTFADETVIENNSKISISIAPISLMSLMLLNEENENNINDIWMSLSLNVGNGRIENNYFISKYPNILNIGIERRCFRNGKLTGFFHGPFISIDYSKLELQSSIYPSYSTNEYETDNTYNLLGIRIGEEIGFRFKIRNIGITPKIGVGLPLYYLIGLENKDKEEYKKIYINNMLFNSYFVGVKIDFLEK